MYKHLHNNIQTGNDRIEKIKSKILFNEFKRKYQKNTEILCGMSSFRKVPYIKNNSNKLLISRGYLSDCSRNKHCENETLIKKDISCNILQRHLDTNNNFYSQKTFNNFDIFIDNSGTSDKKYDINKNELYNSDSSVNTIYKYDGLLSEREKRKVINEKFSENINRRCKNDIYMKNNCYSQTKISNLTFLGH